MTFPIFGTIKIWIIGILTLGMSILFGLWKNSQFQREKEKLNRVKAGKKFKDNANKALIDGLQNEVKVNDEPVKDSDTDRFY